MSSRVDPDYVTDCIGASGVPLQGATVRRAFTMYKHLQIKTDVEYEKAVDRIRRSRHSESWLGP